MGWIGLLEWRRAGDWGLSGGRRGAVGGAHACSRANGSCTSRREVANTLEEVGQPRRLRGASLEMQVVHGTLTPYLA
jgi:hypothetical protein